MLLFYFYKLTTNIFIPYNMLLLVAIYRSLVKALTNKRCYITKQVILILYFLHGMTFSKVLFPWVGRSFWVL